MPFQPKLWTRFEANGIPIYVRGDKPDWFVPNTQGDILLQKLSQGKADLQDNLLQRFLARLPDSPPVSYNGRAEFLQTDHLRELWFHISNRCNQSCRHCLFTSSSAASAELSAARILELANQAAALGCRVYALTGGEPLVHPEFEAIVDGLLALAAAHVVVLTNGVRLEQFEPAMARWPAERFHLQVSVDGLRQHHDRLRGRGAFDALAEQLSRLRKRQAAFTISMCVMRENLADMAPMVDLAADLGAANVHFMWYFIRGRGMADRFPSPEEIYPHLLEAARRAEARNIALDNLEVLRSQVFAPSGTIYDGAGSAWEALAVGPEGRLYPSPALVGVESLATTLNGNLADAWRGSSILAELRRLSVSTLPSPLRFLTGGGDPDHSYLYSGVFLGNDPYRGLFEQAMLWLIAQEAGKHPAQGPPRLRLKMGEILASCGAHGPVALTHSNCLLAAASPDSRTPIKKFYRQALDQGACCDVLNPVCYPEEVVAHIPPAARVRGYGCGSPVLDAHLQPGERVLDLGCGMGVECFIASRLVGASGQVCGVDMLDPMLALSRQGALGVAAKLGYNNLQFKQGYLEDLPLPDQSLDVVLSNCVINLSNHKRRTFAEIFRVLSKGGRLIVSDVVCETEPPAAIKNDDTLRGECLAGALTQRDLFGLLDESGFVAPRVVKRFPYRTVQGHPFFSLTYEARKPEAKTGTLSVMYRGPGAALLTGKGTLLPVGITCRIDREEMPGDMEELLIFDDFGAVQNLEMTAPSCCSASGPATSDHPASPPSVASTSGPRPPATAFPVAEVSLLPKKTTCCPTSGRRTSLLATPSFPLPTSRLEPRHNTGCLVCGTALNYLPSETSHTCHYCRNVYPAAAQCENGHFVCDSCHTQDGLILIEHICLTTTQTDMIALMQEIRRHPAIPRHGPEHHALVPGVILATYRNLGEEVTPALLHAALERGKQITGGFCGHMGACGAALGVGIAFSLLLDANPLKPRARQIAQTATQAVLLEMASLEAARCCQRDTWLALTKAAELSRKFMPMTLMADAFLTCEQTKTNKECLGVACPLHP